MRWVDVRIYALDSGRALEALRAFAPFDAVVDYDPPRAYLEDGVTKAPEIELSVGIEQEQRVVNTLRAAGVAVYASRTRLDGPLAIPTPNGDRP